MPDAHDLLNFEPVQFTVDDVPSDVAAQIREAQARDPEFLRHLLLFGVTHRAVFEALNRSWRA